MDEAILDVVLQGRIAAHCSSIRPHNLAFSVARSPDIRRSQRSNSEAIVGVAVIVISTFVQASRWNIHKND